MASQPCFQADLRLWSGARPRACQQLVIRQLDFQAVDSSRRLHQCLSRLWEQASAVPVEQLQPRHCAQQLPQLVNRRAQPPVARQVKGGEAGGLEQRRRQPLQLVGGQGEGVQACKQRAGRGGAGGGCGGVKGRTRLRPPVRSLFLSPHARVHAQPGDPAAQIASLVVKQGRTSRGITRLPRSAQPGPLSTPVR